MAWALGPAGETYNYRMAATIDTSGVTPGAAYDVAITIGPDQEAFWGTVQSNGYDIDIGYGDGSGLIPTEIKVEALFPEHEHDEFTELFWNRIQECRRQEGESG